MEDETVPRPRPPLAETAPGKACRWPMWALYAKPTHIYCDKPRQHGARQPYCPDHCQVARLDIGDRQYRSIPLNVRRKGELEVVASDA